MWERFKWVIVGSLTALVAQSLLIVPVVFNDENDCGLKRRSSGGHGSRF